MTNSLSIVIVDKAGLLKELKVKDFSVDNLYKKCGFKKDDNFELKTEWKVNIDDYCYVIRLYGKEVGKANMENKYDFPPPVDNMLYFGSCALVCLTEDKSGYNNLTKELWNKIYEKLFGGFEKLDENDEDDENEEDELNAIQSNMKTKHGGYLKDGFVVDGSDDEDNYDEHFKEDEEMFVEELGSELSEEDYIESDDE